MIIHKKTGISIGISIGFVMLWLSLLYVQEQLMLDTLVIQIFFWLLISVAQLILIFITPKLWKIVPVVGVIIALAIAAYCWVGARITGLL